VTSTDDSELVTVNRPVASVQRLASAALCLVAVGLGVFATVSDVWSVAAICALGLALAVQSYRAIEDPTARL